MTGSGEAGKSASGDSSRQQSAITCRCGASWTAPGAAHCAAEGCHKTFAGVSLFDRHRRNYRCVDPETIGMEFRNGMWRSPELSAEDKQRIWGGAA